MADAKVPSVPELLALLKKKTIEELNRKAGSSALSPEDLQIVAEAAAVILRIEEGEESDDELVDTLKREAKQTISLRTNSAQDLRIVAETVDLLAELDEGAEWV